jgi:nucleoside 2-deoxyribosyltransferase
MRLYYAHSIRWAHTPWERTPQEIIAQLLARWHTVSSEEFYTNLDPNLTDREIFERDTQMIRESDLILANVSNPSLGVGYELGYAEALGKPVICFYQKTLTNRVSAMVTGNASFKTTAIQQITQIQNLLSTFQL